SYITLDANKIESATLGEYLTKAGYYGRLQRYSDPQEMPTVAVIIADSGDTARPEMDSDTDNDAAAKFSFS
ncbi:hypothetical protein GJV78_20320, partial [Escherichia alba]|nr:hypothetical protein [Intestinirhabdus alba]